MFSRRKPVVIAALVMLTLAGCDSVQSGEGDGKSEFELSVSGEFTTVLSGNALFADALNDDDRVFLLQLQSESDDPYVLVSIESFGARRLEAGEYRVVGSKSAVTDAERDVVVVYTRSQTNPFLFDPFNATGGTLTITESSARAVEGLIAFDAAGQNGRTIHAAGAIHAIPGR